MSLAGVVLAAGLGTRLRPLTTLRPKALCPVGNVTLLDHAMSRSASHVSEMAVNAHHLAEQVVSHVGDRAHVQVEEPEPLGTAGALGRMRDWIGGRDVLLTNADTYLPDGLDELVGGWDGERCRLLVSRADGGGDFDGHDYVGACLLPWSLVVDLRAEPTGLYEVLWRGEHEAGRLDLVPTNATAIDCGTPADYLRANLHASGGESVVGAGALVEGRLERCVVWDGAYVGPDEHLTDTVRAGTRSDPLTLTAHPPR